MTGRTQLPLLSTPFSVPVLLFYLVEPVPTNDLIRNSSAISIFPDSAEAIPELQVSIHRLMTSCSPNSSSIAVKTSNGKINF